MKLPRRRFLHLAAGAAAFPAVSRIASAQAYPARPVRIVVPDRRRRRNDILARLMGNGCRSGSASNSSSRTGPAPAPTLRPRRSCVRPRTATRCCSGAANAINATLYDKLNFNFIRDIAPVASIGGMPNILAVHPSIPAKTVPAFIAYAKANPGKLNIASAGNGAPTPYVRRTIQDDDRHQHGSRALSWRGACMTDLIAGQVQVIFETWVRRLNTSGQESCGRWLSPPRCVWRRCLIYRRWVSSCPATRREVAKASADQRACPRNRRQAQYGDQRRPRRSRIKARFAELGALSMEAHLPISVSSSQRKLKNGRR